MSGRLVNVPWREHREHFAKVVKIKIKTGFVKIKMNVPLQLASVME